MDNVEKILNNYLHDINTVISSKIGIKTEIKVYTDFDYRHNPYYYLKDERNLKEVCGIMEYAFSYVTIKGNVYESEDGITINFQFRYDHINGGSNGADFCRIGIDNNEDFVKLYY